MAETTRLKDSTSLKHLQLTTRFPIERKKDSGEEETKGFCEDSRL